MKYDKEVKVQSLKMSIRNVKTFRCLVIEIRCKHRCGCRCRYCHRCRDIVNADADADADTDRDEDVNGTPDADVDIDTCKVEDTGIFHGKDQKNWD